MKHRVLVTFLVDEEDSDSAEAEVDSLLSDTLNAHVSSPVEEFEILDIDEVEEEEE